MWQLAENGVVDWMMMVVVVVEMTVTMIRNWSHYYYYCKSYDESYESFGSMRLAMSNARDVIGENSE